MSSASTVSQSVSLPAPPTSNYATNGSSIPNLIPATSPVPSAPSFHIHHQLVPGTPMASGPPGMPPSQPVVSTSPSVLFPPSDSSASTIPGPNMHATPNSINTSVRPQICGSYPSLTPVVSPPHAIWFQPSQLGGMPRPPFLPYSASFHGPLPFPARGMPLPSVPLPDPQPPGVTPVQVLSAIAVSSGHGNQLTGYSAIRTDLNHPERDSQKHVKGVGYSESISLIKDLDDWTAHKTKAGIIYYYNALTGESTYEKPSGFKGEPDNLMVQPTSVSMERGLKEEDGGYPKCTAEAQAKTEAEEDEDDFIMEEVKRRLKELRRNSFMALIPEEEEEQQQQEVEGEGETSCGELEWRDVEAEGRQWWGGFGAVYDQYCERMLFFYQTSIQPLIHSGHESASPRSTSKKSASPLRCLSLKRIEEPEDEMEHLHPPLTLIDSYHHIETAYVAHISLSWEALHCQYTQLNHLISCQPQNPTTHYNLTAQLFQQFQVLLQRFIENEPFQQGLRPAIYARTYRAFPKMLHVPNIQASDPNETQEQEYDILILAPDLLVIIEASIFTFHRFLKMDKKISNSASLSFRNQTQDATLLARIRSSLDKKKTKLKELRKKSKGWKQKTWPQTYEDMQLLFGAVDIKIISRLVKMSRITKGQLLWCEEKMNKLDVSDGKLRRDPSPLLFPC